MKISQEEEKRVRKTLFMNLIFADAVTVSGLLTYFLAGHKFEMVGFFTTILGIIWIIMTITKFFKFKRFLSSNQKQK